MKKLIALTKTAALLGALALAAVASVPNAAEAKITITCRGAGDSCPITLNGDPVELALESVVAEE